MNFCIDSRGGAGQTHRGFTPWQIDPVHVNHGSSRQELGFHSHRTQSFTIKITGGPDGDVAGNEMRILHREYGPNAVIIGIADGSGSGEDPDGLLRGLLTGRQAPGSLRSELTCTSNPTFWTHGKVIWTTSPARSTERRWG